MFCNSIQHLKNNTIKYKILIKMPVCNNNIKYSQIIYLNWSSPTFIINCCHFTGIFYKKNQVELNSVYNCKHYPVHNSYEILAIIKTGRSILRCNICIINYILLCIVMWFLFSYKIINFHPIYTILFFSNCAVFNRDFYFQVFWSLM